VGRISRNELCFLLAIKKETRFEQILSDPFESNHLYKSYAASIILRKSNMTPYGSPNQLDSDRACWANNAVDEDFQTFMKKKGHRPIPFQKVFGIPGL
jgi:hypothetical protein